jgi:hypothetical protein
MWLVVRAAADVSVAICPITIGTPLGPEEEDVFAPELGAELDFELVELPQAAAIRHIAAPSTIPKPHQLFLTALPFVPGDRRVMFASQSKTNPGAGDIRGHSAGGTS